MGIKALNPFLRKKCPEIFNEIPLSNYAYKKVAVDITLFICKYKTVCGDRWITALINLVSCLRRNEIHCIFVYDTKSPDEKKDRIAERREHREKLSEKVEKLKEEIDNYYMTREVSEFLMNIYLKYNKSPPPLLNLNQKPKFNIKVVEKEYEKVKNQVITITKHEIDMTKELFDYMGIQHLESGMEAETMCSQLCIKGEADAVLSEDTDVLAYGTPKFLTKINTFNETCVEIDHSKMTESLGLTIEQFTDLCIMCGTDYNSNIRKIGPAKSYDLILEHINIDGIAKETGIDVSILNHERGREMFSTPDDFSVSVPFSKPPDFDKLEDFFFKHRFYVDIKKIKRDFSPKVMEFVD